MSRPTFASCAAAARPAQGRVEGDRARCTRGTTTRAAHPRRLAGLLRGRGSTGWPSTSARPPSRRICATCATGRCWPPSGVMNPQIRFGEDLMSRVSYAMMNPGGAVEMTAAVRAALNELVGAIGGRGRRRAAAIFEMVFVCNPVMHHLLLGHRPGGTRPGALRARDHRRADALGARDLDLAMQPGGAHLHPALHRRACRRGCGGGGAGGGARTSRRTWC